MSLISFFLHVHVMVASLLLLCGEGWVTLGAGAGCFVYACFVWFVLEGELSQ